MEKKKLLRITKYGLLLLIVAIGAFCTAYMAAIWATQPAELSGARVEIFTTEASAKSSLEIDCNSGHTKTDYTFSVTNTTDGAPSDVATQYLLCVTVPAKLPDGLALSIDGIKGTPNSTGKIYTFASADWTFAAGVAETRNHTLTINADPELVDFNSELDKIRISVKTENTD